jgi:hypothetical protein
VSAKEPVTDPITIPTALSQGIDYQNATWYGILAPAKTPKAVLQTLSQAISEVGKDPELQAKIRAQGIDPRDIELEKFDAHIQGPAAEGHRGSTIARLHRGDACCCRRDERSSRAGIRRDSGVSSKARGSFQPSLKPDRC